MDASQEYNRSRKDCPFIPDLGLTRKSTDLSITLLNIQSLRKHTIDISGDVRFHTDILSFTETHIFPGENILDIENTLNQVNIHVIVQLISTKVFSFIILMKLFY